MKLYIIENSKENYEFAIVAAENEKAAAKISLQEDDDYHRFDPKKTTVEYIGEARSGISSGPLIVSWGE